MRQLTRRDFLRLVTSYVIGLTGLLGALGIGRFLSFRGNSPRSTTFDLGSVAAFPPGSRIRAETIPALVIHDDSGIRALSLQCTHLGCTVDSSPDGFQCPCHGSQYDEQGRVLKGPAIRDLPVLETELGPGGNLLVHVE